MTLVVWSGGCDSTLVLYNALKDRESGERVRTISIKHPQINSHSEQENARKAIKAELGRQGFQFESLEIEVHCTGGSVEHTTGLPQAAIWLSNSMQYLNVNEKLLVGYIRGDDVWHYWTQYQSAFNAFSSIRHLEKAELSAPLEWVRKSEVIALLQEHQLLDLTFWCEDPRNDLPCGQCVSCLTHQSAIRDLNAKAAWPARPTPKRSQKGPARRGRRSASSSRHSRS